MPGGAVIIKGPPIAGSGRAREIFTEEMVLGMRRAIVILGAEVRRTVPARTGHLRRSFAGKVEVSEGNVVGSYGTSVEYAKWLDEGTGEPVGHQRIKPRNAQALFFVPNASRGPGPPLRRFTLTGQARRRFGAGVAESVVYARSVAGQEPTHFFRTAEERAAPFVTDEFVRAGEKAAARIARGV